MQECDMLSSAYVHDMPSHSVRITVQNKLATYNGERSNAWSFPYSLMDVSLYLLTGDQRQNI